MGTLSQWGYVERLPRMTAEHSSLRRLTPRQVHTLNTLLAVGGERPYCPPELVAELETRIAAGTEDAVRSWTAKSFHATKGQLLTARRCEGQLQADAQQPRAPMHPAVVVGIVAHRAVQLSATHPGRAVADYVRQAVAGARASDESLDEWWSQTTLAEQSDLLSQISSRVLNFLDDWPPLAEAWSPRFEESMVAKVGGLSLSCRADLMLGRPRADLKQTILIVDLKSGALKEEHQDEASFYALVATLRYRIAPWRSTVYSLSSGDYCEPDITPDRLLDTADWVIEAVNNSIAALTEARPALLSPGDHCRFCPARQSCLESPHRSPRMDDAGEFDLDTFV